MKIPRLYYPQNINTGDTTHLTKELTHYLTKVLRLKEGAHIVLFNGQGGEYSATLQNLSKSSSTATIESFTDPQTDPKLPIHLVQGISRGERMQYVIQKAVELGASNLHPVFTEFCEVKLQGDRAEKRLEHWQSIANSACEQCGRTRLMTIHPAIKLTQWMKENIQTKDQHIRLTLDPYAKTPLSSIASQPEETTLLIGPEGGLSQSEIELAKQHGFQGIKLGPRILRTETATAAALSVINLTWGDFN